ncbi:alpha/beta fold hydrolase [Pseudidiomarina homiensis]|uniref:alpha/beta fold hydrolase n=1 Tax=Pseudidiomarina homiensis TaxID=364198 RepID=UPI00215A637C|nr:alpha/beta hydrolase [Pseudidiomarina homiensis]
MTLDKSAIWQRNKVTLHGNGPQILVLGHGFGCDQQIWLPMIASLGPDFTVVTFDHVGCGRSDLSAFTEEDYATLHGYKRDLIEILETLEGEDITLVGHSVSGLISMLVAIERPDLMSSLVAIGPSPRYIDDPPHYNGGFEEEDIEQLLAMMQRNHFEWAGYLAPIVMKNTHRPELAERLRDSFANANPAISRKFAESTFYCDHRRDLAKVPVPVGLMYCEEDVIVPVEVIDFMADAIPHCDKILLDANGHYPHMSHPEQVASEIKQWLRTKL